MDNVFIKKNVEYNEFALGILADKSIGVNTPRIISYNEVNKTLNKRVFSYDEVVKKYRIDYGDERASNKYFNKKTLLFTLIIIVCSGLGYLLYKKYPRRLIYKN